MEIKIIYIYIYIYCDSLHARLNNHYEAWNYKKKKQKRLQDTENLSRRNPQLKDAC